MPEALFLADFFGVSNGTFLHWMLAISLTLLVLDVFFNTEFLSWVSMLVFSLWGTMQFDLPVQWSVLVYICILMLSAVFYYTLWTHCVRRLVMDCLLRRAPREAQDCLAGTRGRIVGEGDSLSVKYGDQFLPVAEECRGQVSAGEVVIITEVKSGFAWVKLENAR